MTLHNIKIGRTTVRISMIGATRDSQSQVARSTLAQLGGGGDTREITFPSQTCSISHSGEFAVAAMAETHQGLLGMGVDFEATHPIKDRMARFFLTGGERAKLENPNADDLLRLWTVKEALYKATHDNSGVALVDLITADPAGLIGTAHHEHRPTNIYHYSSTLVSGGWLTVAACVEEGI